ncbi:hypothetical protein CTM86_00645 [Fusobacterium pseudoperiodonticum]|uniref:Uncharacterized protein n=1 Tax=Fusobacterium pseudoperiodonticum TaxID=2663009 RepID=A0AAD0F3G6_9FUSO|nr:hypothetical protein [Fusobacterium pseudoperiodonticum]ATV65202.1 hypothetical protein CTM86_00645 [Fusobacterium pseudoperiodonticum]
MKKVKNDSQPFILYIIPIFVLPFAGFFVGLYFYAILSSFDKINFGSIYGILLSVIFFYVIVRGLKNGILYFIPREECYIEDDNLIYRRIFLCKFIFKELRIRILDIENIIDKGYKIPKVSTHSLVLAIFFKPYERIVIEMKSGKEYKIFVDADPYSFSQNYDNNKFIKNYNELKEMVIEEQNKLFFNQKIKNLNEKYNSPLDERYDFILNKIINEEILFIAKKDNNYIVNGSYDAVEYLEIFKNIYFEEVELDSFYSYVLSKKENQDKKVLVGYNGTDGKEVTMSKFKEDINKIRDSRRTLKKS